MTVAKGAWKVRQRARGRRGGERGKGASGYFDNRIVKYFGELFERRVIYRMIQLCAGRYMSRLGGVEKAAGGWKRSSLAGAAFLVFTLPTRIDCFTA